MVIRVCKSGLPSTNQISMVSGEGAGIVNTDDGPWPLLLLLALSVNYHLCVRSQ